MGAPSKIVLLALVAFAATAGFAQATNEDGNFCQGCRSLVSIVQRFNSSSHRSENRELFQRFCELYYQPSTDFQEGPCPMFVEGLFLMLANTDAVDHCDQIGACSPDEPQEQQPSDDIYSYLRSSLSQGAKQNTDLEIRGDNFACPFCEQLVQQAKAALTDPATIDQTKKTLESLCVYLKVVNEDKVCKQYLDQFIDQLLSYVRSLDPKRYCHAIRLCSATRSNKVESRKQSFVDELERNLPSLTDFQNFGIETSMQVGERIQQQPQIGSPSCMLCKTVIKELFNFLRNNNTEENIMNGLDQICHLIYSPGTKRDQCDSMVKAYTREIVQLMIDETDPEVICTLLEQCVGRLMKPASRMLDIIMEPKEAPVESISISKFMSLLDETIEEGSMKACLECKMLMKYIKDTLSEPKSEEEMKVWLKENLCAQLPAQHMRDACSAMIDENSDIFFKTAAGMLDPRTACRQLGVCNSRNLVSVFNAELSRQVDLAHIMSKRRQMLSLAETTTPAPDEDDENFDGVAEDDNESDEMEQPELKSVKLEGRLCDRCVHAISDVDHFMSKHPANHDVKFVINIVCRRLPNFVARQECKYVLNLFGRELMHAVSHMKNPRQLCHRMHIC